ncbi:MAG: CYTH domain-containing protein [Wenzhouxiangella sp.]
MGLEIERKFLVSGDFRPYVSASQRVVQAYLCSDPARTVRVRLTGRQGFLTIKGPSDKAGLVRYEWERELPAEEAVELLALCEPGRIDKVRHRVDFAGHCFEVDEFFEANSGLVIAELELATADEPFERPAWLGREVTGQARYYNSGLIRHPYRDW